MDRLVSALGTADGPRATHVVGRRRQRVVLSLARGPADGVDGWQVDDVEAQLAGVRQPPLRVAKRPMALRISGGRAGEKFVPRAEHGALALCEDAQLPVEPGRDHPIRVPRRRCDQTGIEGGRKGRRRLAAEERLLPLAKSLRIGADAGSFGARRGRLEQGGAFEQLGGNVAADVHLPLQLVNPGAKRVRPGLDAECVQAVPRERQLRLPRVVADKPHRLLAGLRRLRSELAPADHGGEVVVALLEDVGRDAHRLARHPLHRKPAAVELRLDVLDDGAAPALGHCLPPAPVGSPGARTEGRAGAPVIGQLPVPSATDGHCVCRKQGVPGRLGSGRARPGALCVTEE